MISIIHTSKRRCRVFRTKYFMHFPFRHPCHVSRPVQPSLLMEAQNRVINLREMTYKAALWRKPQGMLSQNNSPRMNCCYVQNVILVKGSIEQFQSQQHKLLSLAKQFHT